VVEIYQAASSKAIVSIHGNQRQGNNNIVSSLYQISEISRVKIAHISSSEFVKVVFPQDHFPRAPEMIMTVRQSCNSD